MRKIAIAFFLLGLGTPFSCLALAAEVQAPAPVVVSASGDLVPGFAVVSSTTLPAPAEGFKVALWEIKRGSDETPIELVLITADQRKSRMAIKPVLQHARAVDLFQVGLCPSADVITNGSFYTSDQSTTKPLGLVRIDGTTQSKPSKSKSGGFFVINAGKPSVLPRSQVDAALAAQDAIESKPLLVEGGHNGMRHDDGVRFDRVAVGTASGGYSVVAGAFGSDQNSVSLFEFEQLATAAASTQALLITDLIAVDGGPSAHIYLPLANRLFGYRGATYLPNVVCVGPR